MNISNWPNFDEEQINEVISVLKSGKVNSWTGNKTREFEKQFQLFFEGKNAIAVSNGTLALTAAYKSLGIQSGDEVITTPRTFIATSSAIAINGAKPVFADVNLNSGNIDSDNIEQLINKSTKAISVVHLAGWPADIQKICDISRKYNLAVVEDCSQAHGAKINNKNVGTFGEIATWSFCQDKIMTTGGEGGMIMTKSDLLYEKMWALKDHGKTKKAIAKTKNEIGFKWLHEEIGSNYRLTEMQAAIGIVQLKKLDEWNKIRSRNASLLEKELSKIKALRIPMPSSKIKHAWYKFYAYLDNESLKSDWTRERIISELNAEGFPAGSGSCSEIYLEKSFQNAGFYPKERLKNARKLGNTSLMFLIDHTITEIKMEKYIDKIKEILKNAIR